MIAQARGAADNVIEKEYVKYGIYNRRCAKQRPVRAAGNAEDGIQ